MEEKELYLRSFLASLASGMISPFISLYALYLGANNSMIGLISTGRNLATMLSQFLSGFLTSYLKRRKWVVMLSDMIWALMWIPIAYAKTPIHLLLLLTLQSFLAAISIPSWTTILMATIPSYRLGRFTGNLNSASGIASFIGNMVAGIILHFYGFFPFIFYLSSFLGIMASLSLLTFREPLFRKYNIRFRIADFFKQKDLIDVLKARMLLNLGVGIASSFFAIYLVEVLGATKFHVGLISAVGTISSLLFYRSWGTLVDYLGRKAVMLGCVIPISFLPLVYTLSPHIIFIYLYTFVVNSAWAGFNIAAFAYLSDNLPRENRSIMLATYNLFSQLPSVIGPFIGGILADIFSLKFLFFVSMFLRLSSLFMIRKLKEKTGFRQKNYFRFGYEIAGLFDTLENFITVYSLVLREFRKNLVLKSWKRRSRLRK